MKKLKAKQIVTIVIAALIGAGICAFPFIWNALHKPEKVAETVEELTLPSVKSTVNPDTPENLLPDGYFKGLDYGTGPFNSNSKYNVDIAENWELQTSLKRNTFSISFTENNDEVYNTMTLKIDDPSTFSMPYIHIVSELDLSKFVVGQKYTVSAYIIQSKYKNNEYVQYTFEWPNKSGTYGEGPISGNEPDDITADFYRNGSLLTFRIGYLDADGYSPEIRLGGLKIESGTESTLKNDIEKTDPAGDYEAGYEAGEDAGYDQGYQEGKNDMLEELTAASIAGPYYIWTNTNTSATYNAATNTMTIPSTTDGWVSFTTRSSLREGMKVKIVWDEITTTSEHLMLEFAYGTGDNSIFVFKQILPDDVSKGSTVMATITETPAAQEQATIRLYNKSGGDVIIKGLDILELYGIEESYNQGYNAGLVAGQGNAEDNYNNGYQAGLAAGRAEGSESSNCLPESSEACLLSS